MWKILARGLRSPFERGSWTSRPTSSEQSSSNSSPQDNKFHLPCPFKLIPCLLEKCQTYPFLPFCQTQKQHQQGANSKEGAGESCKNEAFHHNPCAILGAVGWSGVLVLGWTILQPWYRHDHHSRAPPQLLSPRPPHLHNDLRQEVNVNRYSSLYRLLIHPAFSQPIHSDALPQLPSPADSYKVPQESSSPYESVSRSVSVESESASPTDRQLTPDEAFDEAAEEVRRIHERVMGEAENRQGVACMSLSQNRQAVEHFRTASSLHYAPAAFNLGQCYELGIGTEQDFRQAAHWYQKASDLGHPTAMYNLGVFYAHGWGGLVADSKHARQLFTNAAMLGQPEAQAALDVHSFRKHDVIDNNDGKDRNQKSESYSVLDFFDFPKFATRSRRKEQDRRLQDVSLVSQSDSSLPSSSSSPSSTSSSSSSSSFNHLPFFSQQQFSTIKESSETFSGETFSSDDDRDEWEITSNLDSMNGNSATLYRLAVCYERNPTADQDPDLVFHLYQMAADHGHEKAKQYLKLLEHHKTSGTLNDFLRRRRQSSQSSSSSLSECAMKN